MNHRGFYVLCLSVALLTPATSLGVEPPTDSHIAVVDGHDILKRSSYYQGRLKEISAEVMAQWRREEEAWKAKVAAELKRALQRFEQLPKGCPEWVELEEKLRPKCYPPEAPISKRAFIEREEVIYREFLKDLRITVEEYAHEHNLTPVLGIRRSGIHPQDSVPFKPARFDFMYADPIDITDAILSRIEARRAAGTEPFHDD